MTVNQEKTYEAPTPKRGRPVTLNHVAMDDEGPKSVGISIELNRKLQKLSASTGLTKVRIVDLLLSASIEASDEILSKYTQTIQKEQEKFEQRLRVAIIGKRAAQKK